MAMNETNAAVSEGLQLIALASITPNPDNPRKHYDEQGLKDLTASIRAQGILEPIVVRPDPLRPKTYELVIGERRWRAAKLANLNSIPAIVRTLSDREALEAMVLENLQREDVHPLDEAAGYRTLLDYGADKQNPSHTITSLAERIGKSESYVHARLKLLQLIPVAREAFQRNFLTAGHAVLIARLQPPEQVKALRACWNEFDDAKNVRPAESVKLGDMLHLDDPFFKFHLLAEKGLRTWIQENVNLRLKGVPWNLEDPTLVAAAGACTACPKNSLVNPLLFSELAGKGETVCFDPACYQAKRQAFVRLQLRQDNDRAKQAEAAGTEYGRLRALSEQHTFTATVPDQKTLKGGQWLPAKKDECADVERGVITKGENAGEVRWICANANCKIHKHNLEKPRVPAKPEHEDAAEREAEVKYRKALQEHISALLRKSVDGADRAAVILLGELVLEQCFYLVEVRENKFRKELHRLPLGKAWSRVIDVALRAADGEAVQRFATAKKLNLKKAEADFRRNYEAEQAKAQKCEPKRSL